MTKVHKTVKNSIVPRQIYDNIPNHTTSMPEYSILQPHTILFCQIPIGTVTDGTAQSNIV